MDQDLAEIRRFVAGFAVRQVHASHEAGIDLSGVVQQTMLEVTTAPSPDPRCSWQIWCLTIFRRNLSDEFRRQRATRRDYRKVTTISDDVHGTQETPSHAVAKLELLSLLLEEIERLPGGQREVIRCRYIDRMSTGEIVKFLGRSEASVGGLLRRGLEALSESKSLAKISNDWFHSR